MEAGDSASMTKRSLTNDQIRMICIMARSGFSTREIAIRFGVSQSCVSRIIRIETYKGVSR